MRGLVAWTILIGVFLVAGEGLNLFRIAIVQWLAYGRLTDALTMVVGIFIFVVATMFLGGFIYYRDKKRGKLKREGWLGRPVPPKRRRASDTQSH